MLKDNLKYVTYFLFFILWMSCTGLLFIWSVDFFGWDITESFGGFQGPSSGKLMLAFVVAIAIIAFIPLGILCYLTILLVDYLEIRLKKIK